MGLKIKFRLDLGGIVQENLVHRHIVGKEMPGAPDPLHGWEEALQSFHHRLGIGIHSDFPDLRHGEQGLDDMMEERLSGQRAIILARHTLAMVAHGDKGNKLHGD